MAGNQFLLAQGEICRNNRDSQQHIEGYNTPQHSRYVVAKQGIQKTRQVYQMMPILIKIPYQIYLSVIARNAHVFGQI